MNVSANKLARRLAAVLVSLFAVVVLALPAAAAPQVDKTTPVNDYAGILSQDTIAYVTEISSALQSTCGAEIGVYDRVHRQLHHGRLRLQRAERMGPGFQ